MYATYTPAICLTQIVILRKSHLKDYVDLRGVNSTETEIGPTLLHILTEKVGAMLPQILIGTTLTQTLTETTGLMTQGTSINKPRIHPNMD